MRSIHTCLCCLALLAIVIAPVGSEAQMGAPSIGGYSEDPGMGVDRGDTWRELMEGAQNTPLDEDTFTTVSRSRTYRLSKLDNRLTGKAIAWEQVKGAIIDELIDNIAAEAKAARNVSKKVYGKSSGISYELLPDRDVMEVILPNLMAIETTDEKWRKGSLKLKAKTKVAMARIVPAMSAIRGNPEAYSEISNVRSMAADAMEDILQMQRAAAGKGKKLASDQTYLDVVHQLTTADQLERGRHFALKGETQPAIEAYDKAIEASPGLAIAYRNRGRIQLHLKAHGEAMADFLRAYACDAIDHTESREFGACIDDTDAAIKLFEEYGPAYYQRAVCHVGLGQQKSAKSDFIKAAQLGEKRAQSFLSSKGIAW